MPLDFRAVAALVSRCSRWPALSDWISSIFGACIFFYLLFFVIFLVVLLTILIELVIMNESAFSFKKRFSLTIVYSVVFGVVTKSFSICYVFLFDYG